MLVETNAGPEFHYVKAVTVDDLKDEEGALVSNITQDWYYYYMSIGMYGEKRGMLYRLDERDIHFAEILERCNIYSEYAFPANTHEITMSATFDDLEAAKVVLP